MADLIEVNTDEFVKTVDDLGFRVYPKAVADTLTAIAFDSKRAVDREMNSVFESPIAFTKRAFRVQVASFKKNPIQSEIFAQKQQEKYLRFQVFGGTRSFGDIAVTGGGVLLPVRAKTNAAGNLPHGPIRWLAKSGSAGNRKNEFVGRAGKSKTLGVWKKTGRGGSGPLQLLAAFKEAAQYDRERLPFFEIVERTFLRSFDEIFFKKFNQEISKSRSLR